MKDFNNLDEAVADRPSANELKAMALRQQEQIDSQHQLLAAKEQRLRFLKSQGVRGTSSIVEGERLRRLRERVEAQESKLRRLRALRGQVDLQKTYNTTLNNDLDSIRALFSEKEKELSLAVAKVEALTRQLEDLRRDRRGPLIMIHSGIASGAGQQISPASRELERLRRELVYRNQLSLQQDARLHFQREALQQRQAELLSVDQRISELQTRLQRKKESNLLIQTKPISNMHFITQSIHDRCESSVLQKEPVNHVICGNVARHTLQRSIAKGNIAAVEPYVHHPQEATATSTLECNKQVSVLTNSNQKNTLDLNLISVKHSLVPPGEITFIKFNASTDTDGSKALLKKGEIEKTNFNDFSNKENERREAYITNEDSSDNHKNVCVTEKDLAQQLVVHSTFLNAANKSISITVPNTANSLCNNSSDEDGCKIRDNTPTMKSKTCQLPTGNIVVPARKPVNTVVPNLSNQGRTNSYHPKVNMVAPNVIPLDDLAKLKPALPPKPLRSVGPLPVENSITTPTVISLITKATVSESIGTCSVGSSISLTIVDNLPIKARPLTIKKQPLSEQPRLKSLISGVKPVQYSSKKVDKSTALTCVNVSETDCEHERAQSSVDSIDKSNTDMKAIDELKRRARQITKTSEKIKLIRRVSFDPLALLLDASLEGELELVKKTAAQVPNPSAANDEGITALHNAICAGHLEIVKFLVEFGCDVNAQDSDGWTPLHCAASCNNLAMVKFLVESGACLFAVTLSDHETPAEKCEEDEEGFDGCSEYLYSIQEKLGILNGGEVYAVFSYDAQQPDELSFEVNNKLIILRKGDDSEREWWWAKDLNERQGYVPRNLLGLHSRLSPRISPLE